MRCNGNRCAALVGDVGISTARAIYAVRPDVCKACLPGDGCASVGLIAIQFPVAKMDTTTACPPSQSGRRFPVV
jgi:uncharacterized protein